MFGVFKEKLQKIFINFLFVLMQLRLVSNSLSSQGWPQTSDSPGSISKELALWDYRMHSNTWSM